MIRLNFICEFESDIVLHSSSNTEGKVERFNYIAGSNFLGMVASNSGYKSFKKDAFELFHSGVVRFGDGHIVLNEQKTFHAPFSWFAPKGYSLKEAVKKDRLYNNHFLTPIEYEKFISDGEQLKQQRGSFITKSGEVAKIDTLYRQKSAYDKKSRRSKNSSMFGYYALKKGTKWAFEVELDNPKYKDEIIKLLESANRLGKSRSAEYGRVNIAFVDEKEERLPQILTPIEIKEKHYIFLYAYSRLALTDRYGVNSYQPTLESLGLEGKKIDWSKSQIRTSRYTPFVSVRHNRDPERLIIDKGSVIAVEVKKDFDVANYSQKIEKGVGLYLSEGHGKVIVNPTFLTQKKPKFEETNSSETKEESKNGGVVNSWLKTQQDEEQRAYKVLKAVKDFIKENAKDIKNKKSQWGQIRSMCSAFIESDKLYNELFSEEIINNHKKGFLLHGQAKDKWSEKLIKALKEKYSEEIEYHTFIKLLSIYAPKIDDKKEEVKNV